jgi:hypothetical protein
MCPLQTISNTESETESSKKGLQSKMPSLKSSIGNPNQPSMDDICNLLVQKTIGKDDLGQPIIAEEPFMVFCAKLSITRQEHNVAGQQGHKPEMLLVVDSDSYDKEKKLEYHNKKYSIYKTFQRIDGFTELFCEVNAND